MALADRIRSIYRREFQKFGTITIRRYGGTGAARHVVMAAEVPARVVITFRPPQDLVGDIKPGDRKVIVFNDPAAVVAPGMVRLSDMLPLSKSTDRALISAVECSIEEVDEDIRRIQSDVIALELRVRG